MRKIDRFENLLPGMRNESSIAYWRDILCTLNGVSVQVSTQKELDKISTLFTWYRAAYKRDVGAVEWATLPTVYDEIESRTEIIGGLHPLNVTFSKMLADGYAMVSLFTQDCAVFDRLALMLVAQMVLDKRDPKGSLSTKPQILPLNADIRSFLYRHLRSIEVIS